MLFAEMTEEDKDAPAAYRVLARKYRPTNFDELIGQDILVRTLTNAIESGRLAQAYMLTGVRGVGKTTTARIIARSLNCIGADGKGGPTIKPCGVCANCEAITQDRHVDVLEMDAASRTGVDDIRDIIDGVRYGPVSARYKVYIIDEVHMLSKNAFNALLKTLEEPPPHTKFIFATTEIRKVPVTVLSRCQRFDLRRVDAVILQEHFKRVSHAEKMEAEDEAVALIARAADGSVRDGLSLLDQAIARAQSNTVSADDVRTMLGLADRAKLITLFEALHTGSPVNALDIAGELRALGADPLVILHDLADIAHTLTRAKISPQLAQGQALPELERNLAATLGAKLGMPALTRTWQMLLKGMSEVQQAPDSHQALEMVLIRLSYAADLPPPGDLIKKIQETGTSEYAAPRPNGNGNGNGNGAHTRSQGNLAVAASSPQPMAVRAQAAPHIQSAVAYSPMPENFEALVNLFEEKKEITLFSHLYSEVHVVNFAPSMLEIRVTDRAPQNLAGKVSQFLTEWTGKRWMVTLSAEQGQPTLSETVKQHKASRMQNAENHPLVKAVLGSFPDAKLTALRTKVKEVEVVDAQAGKEELAEISFDDEE
ncbi:MAG: DNA polymerase III subunit gamma/tau [Alphaproteobacteria bacterium]|nr:DNA polymerase III subunit gamma/tau [Alphaproteobacteria bacterium]